MNGYIYRAPVVLLFFIWALFFFVPLGHAEESAPVSNNEVVINDGDGLSEVMPKVAIAPWRLNAPTDLAYLKAALTDMLSSRMGSVDSVEVIARDVVNDAYGFYSNGLTGSTAVAFGRGLDVDYVLYGSLSVLGQVLSLDASLVDVEGGGIETFFFKGQGVESVIGLTEELAGKVLDKLKAPGGEVKEPVLDGVSLGLGELGESGGAGAEPSYTGKFSAVNAESDIIEPVEVPVEVTALDHEGQKDSEAGGVSDGFITKTGARRGALKKKSSWRFKLGPGIFRDMEIVDLDGDGRLEIFAMKATEIHVFRVMKGSTFKKLTVIAGGGDIENISMSAIDADGDGSKELYISRIRGDVVDSCVLKATSDSFQIKSCAIPYLMKSVVVDGEAMLLGQSFNREWGLKRTLYELKVSTDGVARGKPLELPRGAELYGVTYGDVFGDGRDELISIDSRRRLRVYEKQSSGKWSREWKSSDKFGGSLTTLEYGSGEADLSREFLSLEGDLYVTDIDGDKGASEVVLKTNIAGGVFGKYSGRVREFKGGFISALGWDGSGLVELWRTKEITGYIADFSIGDLDEDGAPDLTILVTEGTGFSSNKSESYILFHRLSI